MGSGYLIGRVLTCSAEVQRGQITRCEAAEIACAVDRGAMHMCYRESRRPRFTPVAAKTVTRGRSVCVSAQNR